MGILIAPPLSKYQTLLVAQVTVGAAELGLIKIIEPCCPTFVALLPVNVKLVPELVKFIILSPVLSKSISTSSFISGE